MRRTPALGFVRLACGASYQVAVTVLHAGILGGQQASHRVADFQTFHPTETAVPPCYWAVLSGVFVVSCDHTL